uniref:Uncharacterized protein n=1 Tax=Nicotiana tabacum TaxID=4097 RepID=A0A1S4AXX6_TOBAC|nr:PREDICTED: uncharacterized protein LOC107802521 [Nicotiana tabacum]
MLAYSFVKAHTGAIKVTTRKWDLFKVRQKDNEMLREFISRFQMERMDLPPVTDDWAVQAFTQALNEQVKYVLVDRGSSANIIRSRVVEKLDLQDQIVPAARVLNGFNMASETTKGEIMFPVNVAETIRETMFHVIEGDMGYNALLKRPWIHNMRAVPSALHKVLKFLTSKGVKMVYGE